jgi:DNA repair protein RadC
MLQHFGSIADLARASVQELSLTRRIVEASKILQLQLIDHV